MTFAKAYLEQNRPDAGRYLHPPLTGPIKTYVTLKVRQICNPPVSRLYGISPSQSRREKPLKRQRSRNTETLRSCHDLADGFTLPPFGWLGRFACGRPGSEREIKSSYPRAKTPKDLLGGRLRRIFSSRPQTRPDCCPAGNCVQWAER